MTPYAMKQIIVWYLWSWYIEAETKREENLLYLLYIVIQYLDKIWDKDK